MDGYILVMFQRDFDRALAFDLPKIKGQGSLIIHYLLYYRWKWAAQQRFPNIFLV